MRIEDIDNFNITIKKEKTEEEKIIKENDKVLDMVIAFDTTGSMSSYIKQVKDHVTKLIPSLFNDNPNLKLSIVAFGDYCDMKSKDNFGKAYQVLNLTNDIKKITSFIKEAKNTVGGDSDEFYELVIKKITEETEWRDNSNRLVLLIGDCRPHELGYSYDIIIQNNKIDWKEEAKKAAKLNIQFDTLTIDKSNSGWYKELSKITNGQSLPFNNDKKTSDVIQAAALSRGGDITNDAFFKALYKAEKDKDEEMIKVYSLYKKIV